MRRPIQNQRGSRGRAPAGMRATAMAVRRMTAIAPMPIQVGRSATTRMSADAASNLVPAQARWIGLSRGTYRRRLTSLIADGCFPSGLIGHHTTAVQADDPVPQLGGRV